MNATIVLKPGRERSVLKRHPWIFSGAIERTTGNPQAGTTVRVESSDRRFLAWAALSPRSQIRARIWTWDEEETVDALFFERRLAAAISRRGGHPLRTAQRLVHAEADGLPGLIVDRYADVLVLQVLAVGVEFWREPIVSALLALVPARTVFERSDVDVRAREGLAPRAGVIRGPEPTQVLTIEEGEDGSLRRYLVDIRRGHKTGFYLDQAENRSRVGDLSKDHEVLNCFSYTGGFAVAALVQGAARVISIDSSADAIELARQNAELSTPHADRARWILGDVFVELRKFRDSAARFDLIVLDPPKFAASAAQVDRAARAYKDVNLLALKLLKPGGRLMTFSCSGAIRAELFQSIVAGAAEDAGAEVEILGRLQAAPDHPVVLRFPEGEYLKGLLLGRS